LQLSHGSSCSATGEKGTEHIHEGGSFRGLLGVKASRSGGALAGCRVESGEGCVGHLNDFDEAKKPASSREQND
jgi:hypothetical protein